MNNLQRYAITFLTFCMVALILIGCGSEDSGQAQQTQNATSDEKTALPSNRIAIPPMVRSNLGITFAQAERRRIENTLRAPGKFEYLPTATREYQTMLSGRIDLLVTQFEVVEIGTLLYRIDSPQWREIQQTIAEADSALVQSKTTLAKFGPLFAAHERHETSLKKSVDLWQARVNKLEKLREAGGGTMTELTAARAALATAEAELAELEETDAQLEASQAQTNVQLKAAEAQFEFSIDTAVSLLGQTRAALVAPTSQESNPIPLWRTIKTIEVRSLTPGVVESIDLTNGEWADKQTKVLTVVQPTRLRFHASGLQTDLGVLQDGLKARIVPATPTATGTSVPYNSTMSGILTLGLTGNPNQRTIDLYVTPEQLAPGARSGVSAQLEIITDSTALPELAIPLAAVQRDGLMPVIFRRDPNDPNVAVRIDADLGIDDGRWVAILSGLRDSDEVVLDGGFQLVLATSGSIEQGGHFHSDGTFHEEEH
jgi:multidrug resistance efflux pump